MIEPIHQQRDVDSQHIPIDTLQRIQRIVLEETQGGRTIIRNLVSIMNGEDPDGKPSHRLQSARILLRLGFEEAREALGSSGHQRNAASQYDEVVQDGSQPSQQPLSPEHEKVNKKLVARIRVDSEGGASMVRVLLEILEGNDPDARTRDRIEAAKVLLHWGFGNPAQPDPDFMMFYAPCHPDCLCVCKDLDEDHTRTSFRTTRRLRRSSARRGRGSRRYWSERRRQQSARQEPTVRGGWSRPIRPMRRTAGDSKEKSAASSANATATAALNPKVRFVA